MTMYRINPLSGCLSLLVLLVVLPASSTACGPKAEATGASETPRLPLPARKWKTDIATGHPLVGRFYDATTWAEVTEEVVENACAEATYVLLGEKHDNADHHT